MNKDYYAVLGLDSTATGKEIKKAYKKLAGQWHPDKFVGKDAVEIAQAEVEFKCVEEAYRVLKDPINRAHYDQTGSGDMPKSADIAVKKIILLFAKHIKEAIEKELAMENVMKGSYFYQVHAGEGPSMEHVLDNVQHELEQERAQTEKAIKGLEKGVAALNKYKRKVRTKTGTNLYVQVVDQQLQATSGALAHGGIELIAINTALESLDDYEYVLDDPEFRVGFDPSPGAVDMEGVV